MAQVQYAIDIAAEFASGDQTAEQLDALSNKLLGGGKDADFFKSAIDKVNEQLAAAASASQVAGEALKESSAEYGALEKAAVLASKGAERAALKHAAAVEKLNAATNPKAIERASAAVAKHATAVLQAQASASAARAALDKQADALRGVEQAAKKAAAEESRLGKQSKALSKLQGEVNKKLGDSATRMSTLRGALSGVGGPLGRLGSAALAPAQGFVELKEKFNGAVAAMVVGTVAIAAVIAIVGALAAAVVAAGVAIGVNLANAARSTALSREAFKALHPELSATVDGFDAVTKSTGIGGDKLTELTKKLKAAKVSAADMPAALQAVATAEAALGQGGADQFIDDLKGAKTTVNELSNDVQTKFGGVVARQMLGLEAQGTRLKSNFSHIFGGLDIEPLLQGLTTLVDLFDENTVAGKTIKFLFETIFQPIIDAVVKAIPLVEAFFLGLLIGATKIYIALKPAIKAVKDLLGFDDETSADTFTAFTDAGKLLAYGIGAVVAAFVAVIAIVATAAALFVGPMVAGVYLGIKAFQWLADAVPAALRAVGSAVISVRDTIVGAFKAAIDFLSSINLADIGSDLMAGLAKGIGAGAGAIKNAISNAIKGAISSAKSLLGIASPSKVFAQIGDYTTEGFTGAVEDGAGDAQDAMASLVAPPAIAAPERQNAPSGPFGSRAVVDMTDDARRAADAPAAPQAPQAPATSAGKGASADGATFNFYGVEGAEQAEQRLRETFVRLLEGDLTQTGGRAA